MKRTVLAAAAVILIAIAFLLLTRTKDEPSAPPQEVPPPAQHQQAATPEPMDHANAVRPKRISPAVIAPDASGMSFSGRVISRTTDVGIADAELTFEHAGGADTIKSGPDGAFRFEPTEPGAYR